MAWEPQDLEAFDLRLLEYISQGLTSRDIAALVFLTTGRVDERIARIMRRLAVPNRTAAVCLALREGWIS